MLVQLYLLNFIYVDDGVTYYTPFAKSNGRFIPDTKISMMPSSNLYNLWWVHKVHAGGHFLYKIYYYSTGVQIVSCTLSSDSVLSESTGLFNPVLCVSQWNLFWQKISQSECVFQLMLGLEEHYSPPPLGDFNRLFWRPNWSIIQIMTFKCDLFFKCHWSGPKNVNLYHWFAG